MPSEAPPPEEPAAAAPEEPLPEELLQQGAAPPPAPPAPQPGAAADGGATVHPAVPPEADRRLHPLSPLFQVGTMAKNLLLPVVAVLLFSGNRFELFAVFLLVPATLGAVGRYFFYRYRLAEDELVIRTGALFRQERHIPYARIQNIDLVQGPFHRWAGVASVRLDTAAGQKPEALIRVLSLADVEVMRQRVFGQDPPPVAEGAEADRGSAAAAPALVHMPLAEVIKFGLVSNRGMVVVAAVMGLFWQSGGYDYDWRSLPLPVPPEWLSVATARASPARTLLLALAGLAAALVLLRLLSVVLAVFKLSGFTLTLNGEDLRARYGLLTQVTATIPRPRIQLLSVRQTVLHRWLGRSSVKVETAGGGGGEELSPSGGGGSRQLWLAPLLPAARVPELVATVVPQVDLTAADWLPLAARARWRVLRRRLVLVLFATAAATATPLRFWGLGVLVLGLPWAWIHAALFVRHTRYALSERAVFFKSGWLVRKLSVVRFTKVQVVRLTASPFDRRAGMVDLAVDTAGANRIGHRVRIPYLERSVAVALREKLYREASRTAYRW